MVIGEVFDAKDFRGHKKNNTYMITRKILFFGVAFMLLLASYAQAQFKCINGDCHNGVGKGTYAIGGQDLGIYEGSFKEGKFDKGKFTYTNGGYYEGEWKDFFVHGIGVRYHADGNVQAGRWENAKLVEPMEQNRVAAILYNKTAPAKNTITCQLGNCKNGYSESIDNNGNSYKGEFKNGQYNGYGEMRFANKDYYKGLWANGKMNGQGSLYLANGRTQTCVWVDGKSPENQMDVYILVVGISDYQHFQKLTYTTTDAREMYNHFRSPAGGTLPKNQITLLLDEEATALNIKNKMADLFSEADDNDLIIFYFAGHGLDGAFLPVDYDNGNNILDHVSVINAMMDSEAKFKLILADACHSGSLGVTFDAYAANGYKFPPSATRSGKSIREQTKDFYRSFDNIKSGLAIILSSAPEEVSLEANKLEHGVFTYYVIEGLKGAANVINTDENSTKKTENETDSDSDSDSKNSKKENKIETVTVTELFNYVKKEVDKFTYGFQIPNIGGKYDKDMPVGQIPEVEKVDNSDK